MRNRILETYPNSLFKKCQAKMIYIADFSERSNQERGVEVRETIPCAPQSQVKMNCLQLHNSQSLAIDFNIFDDHQFKDETDKDCEHCECCFFSYK